MRKWINLVESASILPFRQKRAFGDAYEEQMNEALSPKVLENNPVVHVYDIEWDLSYDDAEELNDSENDVDLPSEVDIEIDPADVADLDTTISNWLSDKYGYCVDCFRYDKITQKPVI